MSEEPLSRISTVDRDIITQVTQATSHARRELARPLSFYSLDGIWALSSIKEVRHYENTKRMVIVGNGTVTWHESSYPRQLPAPDTEYNLVIELDLRPHAMSGSIAYKAS